MFGELVVVPVPAKVDGGTDETQTQGGTQSPS